jgi:hypothetical protein
MLSGPKEYDIVPACNVALNAREASEYFASLDKKNSIKS